jgi:DNA polymerase-3 subunit alpha
VEYPDPRVEPILKETYGIMVYQEQVMQMAQIVGGYSLGGADLLRRAMGKKNVEKMAKERAKFREGAAKDGLTGDKADSIFDLMEKFAGYGFNKSHAAAYALVSYQTAWLKAHYPAEFMAATISSDMDNTDKVVTFLDESRAIGLTVLPPDVDASNYMFVAVEPKVIRYTAWAPSKAWAKARAKRSPPNAPKAARTKIWRTSAAASIRPSSTAAYSKR